MSPSKLRPIALAGAAGGACWLVFAVAALASPNAQDTRVVLDSTRDYLSFGLFAVCLALAVPALLALHLHQRGEDGRLGRLGALVAVAGAAGQCVVISAILVSGEETSWFGIGAPIAILTWIVGSLLLGVATRRARLMPSWVALALPVVTVFAIIGSDYGTSALIGGFQLVVGLRIARAADATPRPIGALTGVEASA